MFAVIIIIILIIFIITMMNTSLITVGRGVSGLISHFLRQIVLQAVIWISLESVSQKIFICASGK